MPQPTLAQFKALATTLPPSEKVAAPETADVLSAVVAYVTNGQSLIAAAEKGAADVMDFFHAKAVTAAKAAGTAEPVRGQVTAAGAVTSAPTPGNADAQILTLLQTISSRLTTLEAEKASQAAVAVTPPAPSGSAVTADVTPTDDGGVI